jgi:hypothetical protein
VVIELWAVEAFVFRLLLLVLRKQLLCAFLSLIFLYGMMPFFVVGVLPMLEMQVSYCMLSVQKRAHERIQQNQHELHDLLV